MRKFALTNLVLGVLGLTALLSASLTVAVAHQAHEMACNETAVNAMDADIQSMPDGQAKVSMQSVNVIVVDREVYLWGIVEDDEDRAAVRGAAEGLVGIGKVHNFLNTLSEVARGVS